MTFFHKLFSTYFYMVSKITYVNNLKRIQKQFNFIIITFDIGIAYVSLYISAYHDKCLCYKLHISCLSKQGLCFRNNVCISTYMVSVYAISA
jgi:hypothetical protein